MKMARATNNLALCKYSASAEYLRIMSKIILVTSMRRCPKY